MGIISDNFLGLVAIIFIFGLPVIAVVMVFWSSMHKKTKDKEIPNCSLMNQRKPRSQARLTSARCVLLACCLVSVSEL